MTSTYVNDLRLNELATGDASGSWGTITNTNLELIGEALGYGNEIIGNADTTITIADGAADPARSFYLKITSSADLTTTRVVTLGPNTVSKVWMIENATTGSQVITIKQGSGATINVPNGQVKMLATDGAGSGGAVLDLLVDVDLTGTTTAVNLDVSGAVDIAGDLTLSAGGDGALRFTAASSVKVLDNNAAALVFEEADNAYMTFVTTDGSEAVKFDKPLDINAALDIDSNIQLDGTLTVGVDDTGYDVKFFGATASAYMLWDASADDLILGGAAGLSVNSAALVTGVLTTTAETVFNGGFTATDGSTITTADNSIQLELVSTDADANSGAVLSLYRNSASPADGDDVGQIEFNAENSADEKILYADLLSELSDVTDGTEDGKLTLRTITAGTMRRRLQINGTELVINEDSIDSDFRVESDSLTHALFVQGSDGFVGINNSSPATALDVTGTILADGLTVDGGVAINSNTFVQTAATPSYNMIESDVTGKNTQLLQAAGTFRIRTVDDAGSTAVERMRIDHATGDISFYNSGGSSQSFFWDANAEALGIGTTTPLAGRIAEFTDAGDAQIRVSTTTAAGDARLELIADSGGVSQFRFGDEVAANPGLLTYTHSDNSMSFGTNGVSSQVVIDSSGNVNITGGNLDVVGGITADGLTVDGTGLFSTGLDTPLRVHSTDSSSKLTISDDVGSIGLKNYRGRLEISVDGDANSANNQSEALRIDNSGVTHINGTTTVTTAVTGDNAAPKLVVESTAAISIAILRQDTSVASGNSLGSLGFYGTDTTSNTPIPLAAVQALASGTHAAGDNPTDLRFLTTPDGSSTTAEAMRITSAGDLSLTGGGGIIFVDGGSLSPTATQSNTLDMYERGSFEPIVRDDATAGTAATTLRSYGYYIRVGDWVNLTIELTNINTTGMTGANDMRITGLPYAAASVTGSVNWQGSMWASLISLSATVPNLTPVIAETQPRVLIREWGDDAGTDVVTVSQLTSGTADLYISIGYQVA